MSEDWKKRKPLNRAERTKLDNQARQEQSKALILRIRLVFYGLLVIGSSLLVLALFLLFYVQTEGGRSYLASLAEEQLSETLGQRVTIEGLGPGLPGLVSIQSIRLADEEGPYAHLEELELSWSPGKALTNRFEVDNATVARLSLLRAPNLPERLTGTRGEQETRPTAPPSPAVVLGKVLNALRELGNVRVGSLDVQLIDIAPEVMAPHFVGNGQALSGSFSAALTGAWELPPRLDLDLAARPTALSDLAAPPAHEDENGAEVYALSAHLAPPEAEGGARLELRARIDEPAGGPLSRLLHAALGEPPAQTNGTDDGPPLTLKLDIARTEGGENRFGGTLSLATFLGELTGETETSLGQGGSRDPLVSTRGALQAHPAAAYLPQKIATLLAGAGERPELDLSFLASYDDQDILALSELSLTAGPIGLGGSVRLHTGDELLTADLTLALENPDGLIAALDAEAGKLLRITDLAPIRIEAEGPLASPTLRLSLEAERFVVTDPVEPKPALDATGLTLAVNATLSPSAPPRAKGSLAAHIERMDAFWMEPAGIPAGPASASLSFSTDDFQLIEITDGLVEGRESGARATFPSGRFDGAALIFDHVDASWEGLSHVLRRELGDGVPGAALRRPPLAGTQAKGDVTIRVLPPWRVDVQAGLAVSRTEGLAALPFSPLLPALGPAPAVSGRFSIDHERYVFDAIRLTGEAAEITWNARLERTAARRFTTRLEADLADLALLDGLEGALAGPLSANATYAGRLKGDPETRWNLLAASPGLSLSGELLRDARATVNGTGPLGTLDAVLLADAQTELAPVHLEATTRRDDGPLFVSLRQAEGYGLALTGDVALRDNPFRVSGELNLQAAALDVLRSLLPLDREDPLVLSGATRLAFASGETRQDLRISTDYSPLRVQDIVVKRFLLDGEISGPETGGLPSLARGLADGLLGRPRGEASTIGLSGTLRMEEFFLDKDDEADVIPFLDSGVASLEGGLGKARIDFAGQGHLHHPYDLSGSGNMLALFGPRGREGRRILFNNLTGTLRGHPVKLLEPAMFRFGSHRFQTDGARFSLEEGEVELSGRLDLPQDVQEYQLARGTEKATTNATAKRSAALPEHPEGYVEFTFSATALPLDLIPYLNEHAQGDIRLAASCIGPLAAPDILVDAGAKGLLPTAIALKNPPPIDADVDVELVGGRLTAGAVLGGLAKDPTSLVLTMPLAFGIYPPVLSPTSGPLTANATAELDGSYLPDILGWENTVLRGTARASLTVGGSVEAPTINGRAELENGHFQSLLSGLVLTETSAEIRAEGSRMTLTRFTATDGLAGTYSGSGFLDLATLTEASGPTFDISLDFKDARVLDRDLVAGQGSGSLTAANSPGGGAELIGRIELSPVEARVPSSLPDYLEELEVTEINLPEGYSPPARLEAAFPGGGPEQLVLDVTITLPGRVYLRGRGLEAELSGMLRVAGTAADPKITGFVGVSRGRFVFLGKPFKLTDGGLRFTGESPPSPRLDLTAEARTGDITAVARLTGPARAPQITLTSDPALPKDEILSQLLFGRNAANLSPLQALRLAQAANQLSAGGGPDPLDKVRSILFLDDLQISSDESGNQGVGLGKYLSDDIYVELDRDLENGSTRATVEVELSPNVSLESRLGADSQGGIGLNWKHSY